MKFEVISNIFIFKFYKKKRICNYLQRPVLYRLAVSLAEPPLHLGHQVLESLL